MESGINHIVAGTSIGQLGEKKKTDLVPIKLLSSIYWKNKNNMTGILFRRSELQTYFSRGKRFAFGCFCHGVERLSA